MTLFETQVKFPVIFDIVTKCTQGISQKIIKHGPLPSPINENVGVPYVSEKQIVYIL